MNAAFETAHGKKEDFYAKGVDAAAKLAQVGRGCCLSFVTLVSEVPRDATTAGCSSHRREEVHLCVNGPGVSLSSRTS